MIAAACFEPIRTITTARSFRQSREAWNDLAGDRVFYRWEWLYAWWQALGRGRLAIVVVCDHRGRWLGLAPWYRTRSLTRGPLVRLLGDGVACTDYNGILARPGFESRVARRLAGIMTGGGAADTGLFSGTERFEFEGHAGDQPALEALFGCWSGNGMRSRCEEFSATWKTALPGDWSELEASLGKSFRRKARHAARRLQDPQAVAITCATPAELDRHWDTFVRLHQRRRQSLGEAGCFHDSRFERFLRNACQGLAAAGKVRLHMLFWRDQPVGTSLQLIDGDTAQMYQSGFDPQYRNLEPGHLTFTWALQSAIREGLAWYDFLRGDEMYKSRWKATRFPLYRTRLIPDRGSARWREPLEVLGGRVRRWTRSARSGNRQPFPVPGPRDARP